MLISSGILSLLIPTFCCLGYCFCRRGRVESSPKGREAARHEYRKLEREYTRLRLELNEVRRSSYEALVEEEEEEEEEEEREKVEVEAKVSRALATVVEEEEPAEAAPPSRLVVSKELSRGPVLRRGVASRHLVDQVEETKLRLEAAERLVLQQDAGCRCEWLAAGWAKVHMLVRDGGSFLYDSSPCLVRWLVTVPLGIMSIALFYLDLIADCQVAYSLWMSNNPVWASWSATFICGQYAVVYVCVLVYLCRYDSAMPRGEGPSPCRGCGGHDICCGRFCGDCCSGRCCGGCTSRAVLFGLLGLPLGPLALDFLMFLEPMTLLGSLRACLPPRLAEEFIELLPRYRQARTLIEVCLEGVPQSVLELYIFLRINVYSGTGMCLEVDHQHAYFEINMQALERSLFLTALGIAKLAFDFFVHNQEGMGVGTYVSHSLTLLPSRFFRPGGGPALPPLVVTPLQRQSGQCSGRHALPIFGNEMTISGTEASEAAQQDSAPTDAAVPAPATARGGLLHSWRARFVSGKLALLGAIGFGAAAI